MNIWNILIILSLVLLAILSIVYHKKNNNKSKSVNYKAFLSLGMMYIILGYSTDNFLFYVAGFLFLVSSLVNRSKWNDVNQPKWNELSASEKKKILLIIGTLLFTVILGIIFYYIAT